MYGLFDIGGTNIRITISTDGVSINEPVIFNTPKTPGEAVQKIKEEITKLSGSKQLKMIAGGVPGVLDKEKSELVRSPNLLAWIGQPLRKPLEDVFGCPVLLENDAALVGLGEAVSGAGRGFSIVEYITVSTGVGGARIVDQKLDEKSVGFEPGQAIFEIKNGVKISLEDTISGKAIQKRYGVPPKQVTDPHLWEELAEKLAYGIHNTIMLWSPDVVVLGGSMIIGDPAISVERVRFYLKDMLKIFPEPPVIKKAELGNFAGLQGALHYIQNQTQ